MEEAVFKDVIELGRDIVSSERFAKAQTIPHHSKDGDIALHSLETAGFALLLTRWLAEHGVTASEKDVVRASLLHDIGMTEDPIFFSPSYRKGQTHPREGARIAREEFGANEIQVDAILHHMWPVCCATPPHSAVGWILTTADKCCSMHEAKRTVSVVGHRLLRIIGRHEG